MCLEAYSKLYVIKDYAFIDGHHPLQLSYNTGHYGGALYISDETDSLI